MPKQIDLPSLASDIQQRCGSLNQSRALLVAISGIDGSGKGFVSQQLMEMLQARGLKVANVGIDPWQNLPQMRLSQNNSGPHFYHNAIRFDALFRNLVSPLKQHRQVNVTMDYMAQTAHEFCSFTYDYSDIDVILLEGIFLFQSSRFQEFDMSIWIECSEATALKRAIARNQEELSEEALVAEYHQFYFPAQRFHFQQDNPTELVEFIVDNDTNICQDSICLHISRTSP